MRLLLSALIAVFALTMTATTRAEQKLLPSIQSIVDRGSLLIAVVEGSRPPMIEWGEDGRPRGFDVELGGEIAQALGVEAQFLAAGPGKDDVIDMVAAGDADIGLSYITPTSDRGKRVFFSAPYMIESFTVFIDRVKGRELAEECPRFSALRRLAKQPDGLGILYGGAMDILAGRASSAIKVRLFDSTDEMIAALNAGQIVASLQGELLAKYYLARRPETSIKVLFCEVPGPRHRVAVAVRPSAVGLARWLDIYIAQRGVIIDLDSLLYRADRRFD